MQYSDAVMVEPYPGFCMFLEDAIEIGIAERNVSLVEDAYDNLAFFEEGDDSGSAVRTGLIGKMSASIQNLIAKARAMVERMIRFFTGLTQQKISASEYLASETGQAKFEQDCMKLTRQIDAAYRDMRPVVGKICKLGGTLIDPADVEELCDMGQRYVIDNDLLSKVPGKLAKGAIRGAAYKPTREMMLKMGREHNAALTELDKKRADLVKAKLSERDKKRQLSLLNKCTGLYTRMATKAMVKAAEKDMKDKDKSA